MKQEIQTDNELFPWLDTYKKMDLEELEMEEQYLIDQNATDLRKWGRYDQDNEDKLEAVRELIEGLEK